MDLNEAPRLLKGGPKGVKEWNRRRKKREKVPSLFQQDLQNKYLQQANLRGVNFGLANLFGTDLRNTDLAGADLRCATLLGSNLSCADLTGAQFGGILAASFGEVSIRSGHNLIGDADFSAANIAFTSFYQCNLSEAKGLDEIWHAGRSYLDIGTLRLSAGSIPLKFLKGCGLSDWEIWAARLYRPNLRNDEFLDIQQKIFDLRSGRPLQVNDLFISYSHADSKFVDALESLLKDKDIQFWRDIHDLKSGRIEKQIDRALRFNSTVLLVLSENSVESDWVRWEAARARKLEKELGRDVLCPVALDEAWKTCKWPGPLRQQIEDYNIVDFSEWKESEFLGKQFEKLVDGLELFYKEE